VNGTQTQQQAKGLRAFARHFPLQATGFHRHSC